MTALQPHFHNVTLAGDYSQTIQTHKVMLVSHKTETFKFLLNPKKINPERKKKLLKKKSLLLEQLDTLTMGEMFLGQPFAILQCF